MAARLQHLLLCVSVAVLLVPSCCNASRTAGTRSLFPSTSASDDDTELPTNDTDLRALTSAKEKEIEFNQWARFQQVQEVATDYTPRTQIRTQEIHLPLVTRRENISLVLNFSQFPKPFHVTTKCKSSCAGFQIKPERNKRAFWCKGALPE